MLNTFAVSLLLLLIWGIVYFLLRKYISSSRFYFILLLAMGSAGLFIEDLPLMGLTPRTFGFFNIVLFAILMVVIIIPWLSFDVLFKKAPVFVLKEQYIPKLKVVMIITILLSIFSILYFAPYAALAMAMGGKDVRQLLLESSLMPDTPITTLAGGIASFFPVTILLFYISLLHARLRKYSFFLAVSSLSYIVNALVFSGRDALIFTAMLYILLFVIFRNSLSIKSLKKIKKVSFIIAPLAALILLTISFDRFFSEGRGTKEAYDDLLFVTWGYFYQQPYVFDHTLESFTNFYGFKRRLMFLDNIIPIGGNEYSNFTDSKEEYMFGTQLKEFYEIAGYTSLAICTICYVFFFNRIITSLRRKRKIFPLLLAFTVFSLFTFSGMFYFRLAMNNNEFLFYVAIMISCFFIPDILKVTYYNNVQITPTQRMS